ncbi:uncharacterized protein ACA1_067980 [Acanthamoeba castellanii str. Neff]|uniref:Uncharacterized protein n=1 Tax=Acanthamoeba castellanii (strain ATCC 30010 / Neff) TaxID=1257118 RepID=L8HCG0_ACACF|nr:uncharacterized protein ACA1_067980 [Acanthamoeba castellanii str. Neff]ELR23214.1 hypothetical protein ACA1_067980 [Acanthamoeba castellanii str. Neff]
MLADLHPPLRRSKVVIRYAFTDEDTVSIIRIAIEEAACTSEAWEKSLSRWSNREGWLLPEETQHELFLARCPMMTPFTAQLALAAGPLRQFITSSNEDRIAQNPWIPPRVLIMIGFKWLP